MEAELFFFLLCVVGVILGLLLLRSCRAKEEGKLIENDVFNTVEQKPFFYQVNWLRCENLEKLLSLFLLSARPEL